MIIGGMQKFSMLDYPEHLSAIIFTQGCNFRCQFCYNPMLVRPDKVKNTAERQTSEDQEGHSPISEDDLLKFLQERKGKLDAVVITGGEPTMHADLPDFIGRIREMGYKVKLDTNGTHPQMLEKLLADGIIDYIAMDLKAAPEKYDITTGVQPDLERIRKSIIIIMESGLPYEFRTTLVPDLHKHEDIKKMGEIIQGAQKWYLQQFKSDIDLVNNDFKGTVAITYNEMEKMCEIAREFVSFCEIR